MDFPHAGDLMVISTVYPDGTVAALEELIGSHGGMGGEQTDAFMFHPADMQVGETRNSIDVFHILNARRGLPDVEKPATPVAASTEVRAWAPANLAHGLFHQPSRWVGRALRCLVFDRSAYQEVAKDAYMTGPALLLVVIGLAISAIIQGEALGWLALPARIGGWLVGSLALFGAARVLGGKASYTTTFRALGFASVTYLLSLLALIPPLAPVTRLVVTVASFVAAWIGVAQAQELGGWRSLILPLVYIAVFAISVAVLGVLLTGAQMTLTTLAQDLGVTP